MHAGRCHGSRPGRVGRTAAAESETAGWGGSHDPPRAPESPRWGSRETRGVGHTLTPPSNKKAPTPDVGAGAFCCLVEVLLLVRALLRRRVRVPVKLLLEKPPREPAHERRELAVAPVVVDAVPPVPVTTKPVWPVLPRAAHRTIISNRSSVTLRQIPLALAMGRKAHVCLFSGIILA